MASYNGRILKIDLSRQAVEVEQPGEAFYRKYMGGACLGMYYLLTECPVDAEPLGPDNVLVFAASVVTGFPVSGFSRFSVVARSPLTNAVGTSEAGGWWGPELKRAGFDAIVIKGRASHPVYLWIHDGEAEIRSAVHLWGEFPHEVQERIREDLGDDRVRVAVIGPGGEKMVRFACITNEMSYAAGRNGLGAVMGSKMLKAVAVRGTARLEPADAATVSRLAGEFAENFKNNPEDRSLNAFGSMGDVGPLNEIGMLPTKNFRTTQFPGAQDISAESMHAKLFRGQKGCYGCAVRCKRVMSAEQPHAIDATYGGPEYENVTALGAYTLTNDPFAVCKANELCNKYTLDAISTGAVIAFAMECREKGLIPDEQAGDLDLAWGNGETLVRLVEMIGERTGLGDLLAEGVMRAAHSLGPAAEDIAVHVKGQELPAHDPRTKQSLALAYALSTNGADHVSSEHDTALDLGAPDFILNEAMPLGLMEKHDSTVLDDRKAVFYYYTQMLYALMDSLDVCIYCVAPVRYFTLSQLVSLVNAITGWNVSLWELMKLGERKTNMCRVFNVRNGVGPGDDWLPRRMFEPIESGPNKGLKISESGLRKALDSYYRLAMWNGETGMPEQIKLVELGLEWCVDRALTTKGE